MYWYVLGVSLLSARSSGLLLSSVLNGSALYFFCLRSKYYSWYYFNLDLEQFAGTETIERIDSINFDEFFSEYAEKNKPVVLTGVTQNWKCFDLWSKQNMVY
jgi:hypothetical protein